MVLGNLSGKELKGLKELLARACRRTTPPRSSSENLGGGGGAMHSEHLWAPAENQQY